MRRFSSAPIVLLFLILARCSSTQADVAQASRSELQNYRQIAVLQLEFQVSGTDALSLTENFWDILQATNQGVQRPSFQTRQAEKVQRTQGRLHELESDMINIMNRHLLSRGFNPLDRSAVVLLLKEHSLMNTGCMITQRACRLVGLLQPTPFLSGRSGLMFRAPICHPTKSSFMVRCLQWNPGRFLRLENPIRQRLSSQEMQSGPLSTHGLMSWMSLIEPRFARR